MGSAASTFELPADLGVANAAELQTELLKLIDSPADISLNGGNVERTHTSSLQLLAALIRDLADAGHRCEWTQVSGALLQSASSLGLTELLNMPTQTESDVNKEDI